MHDLLVDPGNFSKYVDRATASSSSIALFGQRANSNDDFWATVSSLPRVSVGNTLIDVVRLRGYGGGMNNPI
jgi:hypothetical protein